MSQKITLILPSRHAIGYGFECLQQSSPSILSAAQCNQLQASIEEEFKGSTSLDHKKAQSFFDENYHHH